MKWTVKSPAVQRILSLYKKRTDKKKCYINNGQLFINDTLCDGKKYHKFYGIHTHLQVEAECSLPLAKTVPLYMESNGLERQHTTNKIPNM